MIIVGGYNSSNTSNLARIAKKFLPESTYHIDSVDLVDHAWLRGIRTLGIGAGTSTPKHQIQSVQRRIGELLDGRVRYVREDRDGELVKDDFGEDVEL
jgi:4-hydroxy-3-methylbut-2-enyl diphosphate reductase